MIPVYTHYLNPSDYGTLELLQLILDVLALLAGFRLSDAVIRYYHHYKSPEDKIQVISTAFLFSSLVSILAVVICQFLVTPVSILVFNESRHASYLVWIFVCLGYELFFIVPEAFLIVNKKAIVYSSLSFTTFFLAMSLNIYFLVVLGMGIWGMIYSMVITKTVYLILLLIFVIPGISFSFSISKLKEMLAFGLPLLPGVLAMFIINFSDRFFIQQYCTSADLGIYSLGYKFGTLLVVLMTDPFFRIWNTQRFEIAPRKDGSIIFGRYFTYYLMGLVTLALGLCMFSQNIILIMADQQFQGSAVIIPLIAISYIFQGLAGFSTLGIMISYRTSYILYANLGMALVNIALNFILIRNFGIYGAAVSTIISYAFLFLVLISLSQRLYPISFEVSRIVKLVILTFLVYGLSTMVQNHTLISIGVKALVLLLLPLGLYASRFFTKTELEKIRAVFS